MHICLPDTREVRPAHGSAFLLYNVHIDGLYHCSLRFKQLLHLHQALSKQFTNPYHQLPQFPPKKLLPLSASQVEERRTQLEKYLQIISQDKAISNSSIFNLFLLEAQRESTRIEENQVHLDIELVNGQKIRLQILTHDSSDTVLTSVCRALGLDDRYHAYFCLCLCGYDVVRDKLIIKRRLSFFESPYVTLQMAIQQQEQLQNILPSRYSNSSLSNGECWCQSCSNQQFTNNDYSNSSRAVPQISSSHDLSYVNTGQLTHASRICYNNHDNYFDHNNSNQYDGNHNQSCYCDCYQHPMTSNQQHSSSSSLKKSSFVTHRILLRKSYWDPVYDKYILNDQQALNLLYIQTVYDIKHSLVFVNKETYQQLESLLATDSKMEYILLARTLEYYNYVHFEPCYSDYPRPRTKVMISIGSKELNMRVLKTPKTLSSSPSTSSQSSFTPPSTSAYNLSPSNSSTGTLPAHHMSDSSSGPESTRATQQQEQILYCTSSLVPNGYHHMLTKDDLVEEEYNFKVLLIRCWRLTSLEALNSNSPISHVPVPHSTGATSRLRGLSLFNCKVKRNSSSCDNRPNRNSPSRTIIDRGHDGTSLLAALVGHSASRNTMPSKQSASTNNNCGLDRAHPCYCENRPCNAANQAHFSQYELSFEYLVSKDTLKWITISSDQAIFISISLQGVVDELVSKREGRSSLYNIGETVPIVEPTLPNQVSRSGNKEQTNFNYMNTDGCLKPMSESNQQLINKFGTTLGYSPTNPYSLTTTRQRQKVRSSSFFSSNSRNPSLASSLPETGSGQLYTAFEISTFKKAPSPIINDAFEGVTNDDDL